MAELENQYKVVARIAQLIKRSRNRALKEEGVEPSLNSILEVHYLEGDRLDALNARFEVMSAIEVALKTKEPNLTKLRKLILIASKHLEKQPFNGFLRNVALTLYEALTSLSSENHAKTFGENAGDNPTHDDLNLSLISTRALQAELDRRLSIDSQRATYPKGKGVDSVDFFLETWSDVLGLNDDLTIKPGTKPTISKQRVRAHDEYLMGLIESFITNRIKAKKKLGKLEGITFLIDETQSRNKTPAFTRRGVTAPAP
jgi:hypothetical protein